MYKRQAQVSNDHIYMTAYRVSLDETEPDYALTFPSQAKENNADNLAHNLSRLNDSDALRVGEGNLVELFEEVAGETDDANVVNPTVGITEPDGTTVTTRNDGYVIVAAEITDGENGVANTPAGGQYQMTGNAAADSGAAHVATEVFYNGKRYDVPRITANKVTRDATHTEPGASEAQTKTIMNFDNAVFGGDAGLVELLKANISGRVWDDRNYDGLQATKTITEDGKELSLIHI